MTRKNKKGPESLREPFTLTHLYEATQKELLDAIIPLELHDGALEQLDKLMTCDFLMLNLSESSEQNLCIFAIEAGVESYLFESAVGMAPNLEILHPEGAGVETFGFILFVRALLRDEVKREDPRELREMGLIRSVMKSKFLGQEGGPKLEKVYAVSRLIDVKKIQTKRRSFKKTFNPFFDNDIPVRKNYYGQRFEQALERALGFRSPLINSVHENYLLFCFDDGEVIESREIFFHPYVFFLTDEFLSIRTLEKFKITKKDFLLPEGRSYLYTTNIDGRFLNILVYSLLERGHVSVEIGRLEHFDQENFTLKSFRLSGLKTIPSENYLWSLKGMTLCLREESVEGLEQGFDKWLYDPAQKALYESQKNEQIELLRATLKSGIEFLSPWDIPGLNARKGVEFKLRGSPYLLRELHEFREKLKKKFSANLDLTQVDEAKKEETRVRFDFSYEDKSLQASFFISDTQEVIDLPEIFSNCITALNSGIGELFYERNTNLASRSRGVKRERDLKFLRHAGVFASMLNICLPSIKDKKALAKKDFNQIQGLVTSFFLSLDQGEDTPEKLLFSKCFSGRVAGLARVVLEDLLEPTTYEHLCYDQGWKIYSFHQSFQELFSLILSYCGQASKGRFYAKQRFKDVEILRDSSSSDIYLSFKNSSKLLQKIISATPDPLSLTIQGRPIQRLSRDDLKVVFGVQEEKTSGWFDLNPQVFFQGKKLSDEQARGFIGEDEVVYYENDFYLLDRAEIPSLDWLTYFWEKIQGRSDKKSTKSDLKRKAHKRSLVLDLFALAMSGEEISEYAGLETQVEAFLKLSQGQSFVNSSTLKNIIDPQYTLKTFQLKGVEWLIGLSELGLGGILADDMGLGKTIQTLAFLSYLQRAKKLGPSLIIVPTSLLYNWQSEAKKFTPDLPVIVCENGDELKRELSAERPEGVFVTTYGLFQRHAALIQKHKYDRVIFDEAQVIKNSGTQKSNLAAELSAQQKVCLTGTPLENHLGEFYTLLDVCVPGALGDFDSFSQTYALARPQQTPSKQAMSVLKKKIRPLVLRRAKENVIKELPEKIETVIQVPFDKKQMKIYKDVALSYNDLIQQQINEGQDNHQLQMLTALLRLRQICTSPLLLPDNYQCEESPKLDALIPKLNEVAQLGQSALVFTNFKTSLFLLENKLKNLGLRPFVISGDVPAKKRKMIIKEFSESSRAEILLMTLKTGGVGLNLTKASYVFHLEPWWNPAAENQGTDRAYRIGQRKNVSVYRYIMKDSVEQRIEDLKRHKSQIFNALFCEDEAEVLEQDITSGSRSLSVDDFRYLLALK